MVPTLRKAVFEDQKSEGSSFTRFWRPAQYEQSLDIFCVAQTTIMTMISTHSIPLGTLTLVVPPSLKKTRESDEVGAPMQSGPVSQVNEHRVEKGVSIP